MSSPAACEPSRGVAVDRLVGVVAGRRRDRDPARARRTARDCRHGRRYGRWRGPRRARPPARSRDRARAAASTSLAVQAGLRLGLSRHCSVVSDGARSVAVDRAAFEDPVRRLAQGRPAVAASRSPMSSSPGRSYLPPQPLKPKSLRRGAALPLPSDDRPGVAQPDVAERLDDHLREGRQRARRRGRHRHAPRPATPRSPLPPAWTASANAATSRSAGLRSASHSSGSLGKPIHTASCGAHSGRGGRSHGEPRLATKRAAREGRLALHSSQVDRSARIEFDDEVRLHPHRIGHFVERRARG